MKANNYTHTDTNIYTPDEIRRVIAAAIPETAICKDNKKVELFNVPCAFDIETTSFYSGATGENYTYEQAQKLGVKLEKRAVMYVWQLGINGRVIVGRKWYDFVRCCNVLSEMLNLHINRRLVIYVHNLAYEFQFIRKRFTWNKVFSLDVRKPLYAITDTGIEFRCSYLLSGYSLAKLSEQLIKYPVTKLLGDLDYSKPRHTDTELTPEEIAYCVNDVRCVMAYIQELLEQHNTLHKLPLTKTGFVRKHCRALCLRTRNEQNKIVPNWGYINLMKDLRLSGLKELSMLQRAFAGGFTHANADYSGKVIENVSSYDFTSAYPFVMVSEMFPMSGGVFVEVKSVEQLEYLTQHYCCCFDVELTNVFANITTDNPLSVSKCFVRDNVCENNGRVVAAKRIATTITDVDFHILKRFYKWQSLRVGAMVIYKRGYLPTPFVKAILDLYENKTRLKGVAGKEVEYLQSKEMLNSCYGMSVTNPLRDEFTYTGVWDTATLTTQQQAETLLAYNESKNRFLFYPWGVWVTAYARKNLFSAIESVGSDYIYSDTDSIKLKNAEKHKAYFERYNADVHTKLRQSAKYHNIEFSTFEPTTIKGVNKLLGVWEFEGIYTRFKTLGAKRYMVEQNGKYSITVSGVNKKTAVPYLTANYSDVFEAFDNYLNIPASATGKQIHTYIDYKCSGKLTDYNGVTAEYSEQTAVHLEPTSYTLSLSVMYLNYLMGIHFKE